MIDENSTGEKVLAAAIFMCANNPEDMHTYMVWHDSLPTEVKIFIYEQSDTIEAIAKAWSQIGQVLMDEISAPVWADIRLIRMMTPKQKMEYLKLVYNDMQQKLYKVLVDDLSLPEWLASELAGYMPESWLVPVLRIVWSR